MKILVLFGGYSAERDVSLDSGRCVVEALRERGHTVGEFDPRDETVERIDVASWDVALPMVHGAGGEDGVLQRELESVGLPYVGSSAEASRLTFDKILTNERLREAGIQVPNHVVAYAHEDISEIESRIRRLSGPVVVKPPKQGSSIGVSIVRDLKHLRAALDRAFVYDNCCLVERYIPGREVTVPVVDTASLPMIEIRPAGDWYDYSAKYVANDTRYVVAPPDLPRSVANVAVEACRLCVVTGIARVDFIVDAAHQAWLLEINTIPGMTSHSLVPKAAAALGLSLGELCEQAILNVIS